MQLRSLFLFLVVAALFSFGPVAKKSDLQFNVVLDGQPVGTYTVSKTTIGTMETFLVKTETAAGLIGRMSHKSVLKSSFLEEKLVSAILKTWVNDELETSTSIKWDDGKYAKQVGESVTDICCEAVDLSSARLFFKEPVGRSLIFHEKFGSELPLVNIGNHQYQLMLPNGGIEEYTYENGYLTELKLVKTFTTITVRAS